MLRIEDGGLGLIPYLMAGHPDRERSIAAARSLAALPIAALELGIPFSDPLADGPVIQRAGQQALEAGMTVAGSLELAAEVTGQAPVFFMSYVNPILAYGPERFAADAAAAGVTGVILPDLPPEEGESVAAALHARGLDTVFLVAPTSSEERIKLICDASTSFVYCVTLTGITGVRAELPEGIAELLGRVHSHTRLPVAAGFGIATRDHVAALRGLADAAAVGSAVVRELDEGRDPARLVEELLTACR